MAPNANPWRTGWRRDAVAVVALAAVTAATFAPATRCGWVNFDDKDYVTANPGLAAGLTAANAARAFTTFRSANWHPITWLSLELDASLWGMDPFGYHLTNVVVHAANAALVFLALRALTGAFWRSAAVALLFAVHPLRVESVAWVSERKDVLSAFFGLLALWAYAGYARRPGWRPYALVALALALSLMCKPMFVTLPCLFLVLDWWPLRRTGAAIAKPSAPAKGAVTAAAPPSADRTWRWLVLEKLPLFALVVASAVVTTQAQQGRDALGSLQRFPLAVRLENAAVSYAAYLGQTVWPTGLAVFYPHPIYDLETGGQVDATQGAIAVVLLPATTVAAWLLRRRAPYLLVGWLWFLGTLVPVIGLVQVGSQARADRYTYFPQVGLLLAACWGVADLAAGRARLAVTAGAVAALTLAAVTWNQLAVWQNAYTLWSHTLAVTFPTVTGEMNLGDACEIERRYDEAAACYQWVVDHDPDNARGHVCLGNVLFLKRNLAAAAREMEEANRLTPGKPAIVYALGRIEAARGHLTKARSYLNRAIELNPDDPEAHLSLGLVLFRQGDAGSSLAYFREAARLDPNSAKAHDAFGVALQQHGDHGEAIREIEQAIHLDPGNELFRTHLRAVRAAATPASGKPASRR